MGIPSWIFHDPINIVDAKGVSIVTNFNELNAAVNNYIQNKDLNVHGRARIMQEQIQFFDGKVNSRLARELE